MGYTEAQLIPGELIVFRSRFHWIVFTWPVVLLTFAAMGHLWSPIRLVLAFIASFWGPHGLATYASSEFALTTRRVVMKTGLFERHAVEVLLQKIEAIAVDQGSVGRLMGYGTIVARGIGGSREVFETISALFEFHRRIQEQVARVNDTTQTVTRRSRTEL